MDPQMGLGLKKFLKEQQYHKPLSKRSKFSRLTFTPFLSDQLRGRCESLVINIFRLTRIKGQGLVATQEGQRCQGVIKNRTVPAPYDISGCWYDHRTLRARFIEQLPTVSRREYALLRLTRFNGRGLTDWHDTTIDIDII